MSKTKAMPGKVDPGYGDPFDDSGKPFATFDAFCLYRQPWG